MRELCGILNPTGDHRKQWPWMNRGRQKGDGQMLLWVFVLFSVGHQVVVISSAFLIHLTVYLCLFGSRLQIKIASQCVCVWASVYAWWLEFFYTTKTNHFYFNPRDLEFTHYRNFPLQVYYLSRYEKFFFTEVTLMIQFFSQKKIHFALVRKIINTRNM